MKEENLKNAALLRVSKRKMTLKKVLLSKIDIKAGEMSFSQRIELGKIFSGKDHKLLKFEKTFVCLHNFQPKLTDYEKLVPYYEQIIEGLKHWSTTESIMLKYTPTPEEKQAGIMDLSKKIGELGTAKAIAKTYGMDPDDVLAWSYAKAFGILYTDLEESKFNRRYQKVISKKGKS
jgi:hypothetical protein